MTRSRHPHAFRTRKTMPIKLLIVESPAKCKKIQGFLGGGWRVQATMGHIRSLVTDLKAIGFDVAKGVTQSWSPSYEALSTKKAAIAALRKAAKDAEVYLGADDDREGEAIAWHTCHILGLDPTTTPRVVFHEITEQALRKAVLSPTRIDMNKFNAQQARSMLDMLIGFTLSPCLWRSVGYKPGLSAGRCQTPALRIIYERDREIESHLSTTSWKITAQSQHDLTWTSTSSHSHSHSHSHSEDAAIAVIHTLVTQSPQTLTVTDRQERIATSQPPKPFITSTLQQEASNRLGLNPKVTMSVAQSLYEAGHITYMRTDSDVLSEEATAAATAIVTERWGVEYVSTKTPSSSSTPKKGSKGSKGSKEATATTSQNAHEAIRPTHFETAELTNIAENEKRLYSLIWTRAIQSVMAAETRDVVKLTAVPTNKTGLLTLDTSWDKIRFAGYRIVQDKDTDKDTDTDKDKEAQLCTVRKNQQIPWTNFTATEVHTAPPLRFTEASLIRDLESKGIGRPSTFATLVETVIDRGYVERVTIPARATTVRSIELKAGAKQEKSKTSTERTGGEKGKLRTTPLGRTVIEWLLTTFGDLLEYDYTATLESHLDDVSNGTRTWSSILQDTWCRYADRYTDIMKHPTKKEEGNTSNKNDYGDGYKMIVSKKGPLFVLERDGQKTRFATVPPALSIQTATRADAEAAFAASDQGDVLGAIDDSPVIRKKGPYGYYVTWKGHRTNCKETETLEDLTPRLRVDTVDHTVGPYKIKRGQYGLYMYKLGSGSGSRSKKPTFVSLPDTTQWATLTLESAEQIYKQYTKKKGGAKEVEISL